jgi:D-3-phosphoglycerate dehydrogenase
MRYVKIMDNIAPGIVRDGTPELGEGYEGTTDLTKADAILIRASDIHNLDFPSTLRCIARSGAGVNNIPIEECARRGIVVFNAPGGNSNAVKELVVGLILVNSRGTMQGMRWVRANEDDPGITKGAEAAKKAFVGREAIGRKVGIVGLGAVGSKVANALVSLGMEVYGYDPFLSVQHAWELSHHVQRVSNLETLCDEADYLTVHVPSKEDTIHMISDEQIAHLNTGAMLLNYARADIVDEHAVDSALRAHKLGLFATDFATPGTVRMPNTLITPHMGACTAEAERNCAHMAISEMKNYLETGAIHNSVNYPDLDMGPCRTPSRFAVLHANVPNMISQITSVLAPSSSNIERMSNEAEGPNAYTLVDLDRPLDDATISALREIKGVWKVRIIKDATN